MQMQWQKATFAKGSLRDEYAYLYGHEFWIRAIPPETLSVISRTDGAESIMANAVYSNIVDGAESIAIHNSAIERLPEFTDNPPLISVEEFEQR